MTSESKILTVSYGTFSCTLEGFDDPYNAMKVVAEYFRDLAAEDRHFGAEPPQPETALLNQFADRDASTGAQKDQTTGAPTPLADATDLQADAAPVLAEQLDDAGRTVATSVEPMLRDVIPSGVIAKLARIRQAVLPAIVAANAPMAPEASPLAKTAELPPQAKDFAAASPGEIPAAEPMPVPSRLAALLHNPDWADEDTAPRFDADSASHAPTARLASPVPLDDEPMVSQTPLAMDPEALDDQSVQYADADPADDSGFPAQPAAEAPGQRSRSDRFALLSVKPSPRSSRVNSRIIRLHPDVDDIVPAETEELAEDVAGDATDAEALRLMWRAEQAQLDTEPDWHAEADAPDQEDTEAFGQEDHDDLARADQAAAQAALEAEADAAEADFQKLRRKIISVRPQDHGGQDHGADDDRTGPSDTVPLVLVSEQLIDRPAPVMTPVLAPAASVQPHAAPVPAPAPTSLPAAATQSPSGQKQRALVPQIEIDGIVPGAVRTGRLSGVIGAGAATAFMDGTGPARDQKSVAAAELDEDDDLDDDLSAKDEAGLVKFVGRVGVKSMADMLEAAAAYAVCIEGRSQFTRSQLMRRLAACSDGQAIDREEGLRSFGTLLRTGRVEKLTRGNYTLSDASQYLAAARRFA